MEAIELRQTARRAYEMGRLRLAGKVAAAALLVGAAAVGLGRPLGMTVALCTVLAASIVLIVYRARAIGQPQTTSEAAEVGLFALDEIPWNELAFWSTELALRDAFPGFS